MNQNDLPEEYQPVSAWGFVGLLLLSAIPCVGIICTIIFACGGVRKKNIVNFARAQLILIALSVVLSLLFVFLGFGTAFLAQIAESM